MSKFVPTISTIQHDNWQSAVNFSKEVQKALTKMSDQVVREYEGIILTNPAGTVAKRIRLNDTGDGLVFEDI